MTRPFSWGGRFALLLIPFGLLTLPFTQRTPPHIPTHRVHDWTTRHAVYPQFGTSRALEAARFDPRATTRWSEVELRQQSQRFSGFNRLNSFLQFHKLPVRRLPQRIPASPHADWSISLGAGETALSMYPAKFSFDITAAPDCTKDFVVFPVNVGSASTQPNIVAFNNLYSGTAGSTGICNSRTVGSGVTDNTASATVLWSYNIHGIAPTGTGGAVNTSPTLSLDGTKVAFVESANNNPMHFHVLAWKSGDGRAANLQTATSALQITTFVTTAPVAGSGTVTDVALGGNTSLNTLSSPFIDYGNDTAYVGNDIGVVYRIKNVFCTTPTCKTTPVQPTVDTSWGTAGAVTTGCGGKLTGPVVDFTSTAVFVGCSNGKLYRITQAGVVTSINVGDGSNHGDIVDPPIVDGVNGFVYAVTGSNGNGSALVQAKTDFSATVTTRLTTNASNFDLHSPVLNDAYFDGANSANWQIYEMAYNSNRNAYALYGMAFNSSHVMTSTTPAHTFTFATGAGELSPSAEFFNFNTGVEYLFSSTTGNFNPNLGSWIITPTTANPSGFPTGQTSVVAPNEGTGGTSAFIVDNDSSSSQASSIYFSSVALNTAVKLTQANLN